jgi:hypothetical protein
LGEVQLRDRLLGAGKNFELLLIATRGTVPASGLSLCSPRGASISAGNCSPVRRDHRAPLSDDAEA